MSRTDGPTTNRAYRSLRLSFVQKQIFLFLTKRTGVDGRTDSHMDNRGRKIKWHLSINVVDVVLFWYKHDHLSIILSKNSTEND